MILLIVGVGKVISTYVEMILEGPPVGKARPSDLHVCGDDPFLS